MPPATPGSRSRKRPAAARWQQDVGGIGGSGKTAQDTGGIGGSGKTALDVGGVGGSGKTALDTGGIGGSGKTALDVGGVGGSGGLQNVGGSGAMSAAAVQACGLQSVNITVASVRVNRNGAADLGSSGWIAVALTAPVRVDLLALAGGAALPNALGGLPPGTYRQMRLQLVDDDAASPLADSVVTAGGVETALAVPGAAQAGLPRDTAVTVADGQVAASWRGLDVCKAVTTAAAGTLQLDAVTQGATQVASAI